MIEKIHSENIRGMFIELAYDSIWLRRFREFKPTHSQLVNLAQQYYTALRVHFSILLKKVPGH